MKKKYKITTHFSENRFVEQEIEESELTKNQKDLIVSQLVKDVSDLPSDIFESFVKAIGINIEDRFNKDMMAFIANIVLSTTPIEHDKLTKAANDTGIRIVCRRKLIGQAAVIGTKDNARVINVIIG